MSLSVRLMDAASIPLAVVRRRARPSELATVVPQSCGLVWEFVRAHEVRAGRHVALYLNGGQIEMLRENALGNFLWPIRTGCGPGRISSPVIAFSKSARAWADFSKLQVKKPLLLEATIDQMRE